MPAAPDHPRASLLDLLDHRIRELDPERAGTPDAARAAPHETAPVPTPVPAADRVVEVAEVPAVPRPLAAAPAWPAPAAPVAAGPAPVAGPPWAAPATAAPGAGAAASVAAPPDTADRAVVVPIPPPTSRPPADEQAAGAPPAHEAAGGAAGEGEGGRTAARIPVLGWRLDSPAVSNLATALLALGVLLVLLALVRVL